MNRLDITILVAAGFAAAASLAAARRWPFGVRVQRRWQRAEPYLGAYIRRSPATFTYAGIIAVTTWVVAGLNSRMSDALLRAQSTNLDNLRSHPLDVLFRSMFFSGSATALPVVALIAAVLAPAEVWLGSARLIFVFVAGHVGATLITALALSQGYYASPSDYEIDRAIDVGVSYGLFCVAAVLVHRLPRPLRIPYAVALLVVFGLLAFVVGGTFTDFGHFVSVLIGFAVYPVIHSRSVDERARIPLYRPWLSR